MRTIFLKSLFVSSALLFATQGSSAEPLPIPNFNVQPPSWAAGQTPIAWGDCIPVPVAPIPNPQPMMLPYPVPMPFMGEQPAILPPPSPFFNTPAPPAPVIAPSNQVACDTSSDEKLKSLQARYDQGSAKSKTKIEEINQALNDSNNQMDDARIIIDKLSEEQAARNAEIAKLKKELAKTSASSKSQSDKTAALEKSLVDESTALKKKLVDLENTNKSLQTKLGALETNAGAQARKLTALGQSATELTGLRSAYKARSDENVALKKKLLELDNANKSFKTKLGALETNAGAQARKLTALGQSATELTALQSAYKARNDEAVSLKAKLAEMNKKLGSLQTAATLKGAQDNEKIKALKNKLSGLDNANKSLKTKLATVEADSGAKARKLTALGQSATELTALQSAYKARNNEATALKEELAKLKGTANTCTFEVADLKKKLAGSDDEKKTLLAKISALEKTSSDQARKITSLMATSLELDGLKSAYKDLSSKKVELVTKLSAATADTDKDGVLDSIDKCPFSLAGAEVNALGCLADKDSDGVVDSKDECPSSPTDSVVNNKGCPKIKDSDGDSVADASDLCPATPAGTSVNEFGCKPTENITLKGVNFATGSARLTANSMPILAAAAETLKRSPNLKIEIAGYTDNQGAGLINKRLSQRRANTVMIQLIKDGVEASRLSAKGYGEKDPVTTNKTEAGRATNRRVELKIRQ